MKNNGYSNSTLKFTSKALKLIAKNTNLDNPENVKTFIANYQTAESYKKNLCLAYKHYVKFHGLSWTIPKYIPADKRPQIPTEEKLNMLISAAHLKLASKLRLSMETGMRPIEIMNLRVRDVDLEKGLTYPATAKRGSGRTLKISQTTANLIKTIIQRENIGLNDKIFRGTSDRYGNHYRNLRNKLARKFNDESIKRIRLYDFRHYYATMLYHKTRDLLLVKSMMGHRKIETALVYTQLIDNGKDEYHSAAAKTLEECQKLLEDGWEYTLDLDGIKLFRKRK